VTVNMLENPTTIGQMGVLARMRSGCLPIFGIVAVFFWLGVSTAAEISKEDLEKEHQSRYFINYASYLIDVGKYMEALESYNAAEENTSIPKTKIDALLAKATLLSSFLDAPEEALKIYGHIRRQYPQAAEIAQYREGLLLFDLQRFKEARATLADYLESYPQGRFRFQAEALLREIAKTPVPGPPSPQPPQPVPIAPPAPSPQPRPELPGPVTAPTPQPPAPVVAGRRHPDVRVRMCQTDGKSLIKGHGVCVAGLGCKDGFTLGIDGGKILLDGSPTQANVLVFESDQPLWIRCGSQEKRVRGRLEARIYKGRLLVLNVLDIEDYLLSVVPSENPASWPVESLKAQAVAARTYAYYQLVHRKNWAYDLVDYAGDQAYGGMEKENPRSTGAVKATSGQVLTYDEKPILAMFSANSGGYTADSQAIFDLHKPYLIAHRDPASLKGGMANWTRKFTIAQVVAALGKIGVDARGLRAIQAQERGPSGRIVKIRLVLEGGKTKVLRNRTTLRRALDLPEILVGIKMEGRSFIFEGHGWGHGVGYSQWGSALMGKEKKYDEILSFYYSGARMEKLW
jgi:stage II sporulation protein D (peptidoglycan lytic transglycosylase)